MIEIDSHYHIETEGKFLVLKCINVEAQQVWWKVIQSDSDSFPSGVSIKMLLTFVPLWGKIHKLTSRYVKYIIMIKVKDIQSPGTYLLSFIGRHQLIIEVVWGNWGLVKSAGGNCTYKVNKVYFFPNNEVWRENFLLSKEDLDIIEILL